MTSKDGLWKVGPPLTWVPFPRELRTVRKQLFISALGFLLALFQTGIPRGASQPDLLSPPALSLPSNTVVSSWKFRGNTNDTYIGTK